MSSLLCEAIITFFFGFDERYENNNQMISILLAVILLALAVAGIAIKLIIKKDGEFKKSCSSIDHKTGKPADCICGGSEEDPARCENYIKHHGEEKEYD